MTLQPPPAELEPKDPYRLKALEVWGGSGPAAERLTVTGFEAFVYCRPHGAGAANAGGEAPEHAGGDLRFIGTCAAGQIVRLTLADIAGHGPAAGDMAQRLRSMIRKHINKPNPTRFARALNWELSRLAEQGAFATAVITTYFAPTDHLIVCNAGHPRPLLYHARERRWELFDEAASSALPRARARETGVRNLPLGVVAGADYPMFATRLEPGDIVVMYTDALIEAADDAGRQVGEQGLLAIAERLDTSDPSRIGPALMNAAARRRGGRPSDDDETMIVLSHTATDPPTGPFATLQALGRLVGLIE